MHGFYVHGPTLTYVTDPALSPAEQQRVLTQFCRCAEDQMLRVAFRLPESSDEDVERQVNWYMRMIDNEGVSRALLPPLIHNRPAVVAKYSDCGLWLSTTWLQDFHTADAYSVHSANEATDAFDAGARELIVGHVFSSESHPGKECMGTQVLKDISSTVRMDINEPVITAIGGISERTVVQIGRARVFNVAAIRAISRSPNIARTLEEIRHNWVTALIDEDLNDSAPLAFGREWGIWHRWEADSRTKELEGR